MNSLVLLLLRCSSISLLLLLCLSSDAFLLSTPSYVWHDKVGVSTFQLTAAAASFDAAAAPLNNLKVSIVGAGPAGLLLAHKLVAAGAVVSLSESRSRAHDATDARAYTLGLGIRGRTAIQSADSEQVLWQVVKRAGYSSERFQLHIGPLTLRLRDERDGKRQAGAEPSLLLFQSDLCRVMADELENRYVDDGRLKLQFETKVVDVDLDKKQLTKEKDGSRPLTERFDLVVGCDGVNSVVRKAIDEKWDAFNTTKETIPGELKVVRLPIMPPKPTAVALIVPKSGSVSAFVEPTAQGRCCVLFAGRNASDPLLSSSNSTELAQLIVERFPLLQGSNVVDTAAKQLAAQATFQASLVKCNTFHYGSTAVLAGDAAHATGGVSGQGVNSALMDAKQLADCLTALYDKTTAAAQDDSLRQALLAYSQRQVPEAKALYDLSFGPRPQSWSKRVRLLARTARDSIFKGRWGIGELPLQTLLTTQLKSFADIRRERDIFYEEAFPDQSFWNETLSELDAKIDAMEA